MFTFFMLSRTLIYSLNVLFAESYVAVEFSRSVLHARSTRRDATRCVVDANRGNGLSKSVRYAVMHCHSAPSRFPPSATTPPQTMAPNQHDPSQNTSSGIFSNVFSFVSRELESFVATAAGGEPPAKVSFNLTPHRSSGRVLTPGLQPV